MTKLKRNLMISAISILTGGAIAAGFITYANIKKPDVITNGQVIYEWREELNGYEAVGVSNADKTLIKSIKVVEKYNGKNVLAIAKGAFAGCTKIENLTVPFIGKQYIPDQSASDRYEQGMIGWVFGDSTTEGTLTWQCCYDTTLTLKECQFAIPKSLLNVTVTNALNIPAGAFSKCQNIESIVIQKFKNNINVEGEVTTIGNMAFYNCMSLYDFDLSTLTELTSIERSAFENCYALGSINIPTSVNTIEDAAFKNCISSKSAKIPSSVNQMGKEAFYNHIGGLVMIESKEDAITWKEDGESYSSIGWYKSWTQTSTSTVYDYNSSENTIYADDWTVIVCGNANEKFGYLAQWTGQWEQNFVTIPSVITYSGGKTINIKAIGGSCFKENYYLQQVEIEEGIETIYQDAFKSCTALKYINFPTTLKQIRTEAFMGCTSLVGHYEEGIPTKNINFAETCLEAIGDRAFKNCSSITDIKFTDDTLTIGEEAFAYCTHLCAETDESYTLSLPQNLTSLGEGAFKFCFKYVPEGFTGGNTHFPTVVISPKLTVIPENAFEKCGVPDLTSQRGEDKGTIYPKYVRVNIDLNNAKLTKISNYAFNDCYINNLRNARYTHLKYIGDYAFYYARPTSETREEGGQQRLEMDQEIEYIGSYAFAFCTTIKELNFNTAVDKDDGTVEEKGYNNLKHLGEYAFYYCNNVDFNEVDLSPCVFLETNYTKSVADVHDSSRYAFSRCTYLKSVKLPGYRATTVDEKENPKPYWNPDTTYQTSTNATIHSGELFKELPSCFFEYDTNLGFDGVYISEYTTTIRNNAFNECHSLKKAYINSVVDFYGSSLFRNCIALEFVNKLNLTTLAVEPITFSETMTRDRTSSSIYYGCKLLKNGPLPVTDRASYYYNINDYTYYGNESLQATLAAPFVIPYSVYTIGTSAFQDCSSMEYIKLNATASYTTSKLTTINTNAFNGCTNLLEFDISKVTNNNLKINDYAFANCINLGTTIDFVLPNVSLNMGTNPFSGWTGSGQKIYFRWKNVNGLTTDTQPTTNFYLAGTTTWEFKIHTQENETYWTCEQCGTNDLKFYFKTSSI